MRHRITASLPALGVAALLLAACATPEVTAQLPQSVEVCAMFNDQQAAFDIAQRHCAASGKIPRLTITGNCALTGGLLGRMDHFECMARK